MSLPDALPPLLPARAHEATGPSAVAFAAIRCAEAGGAALWVRPGWRRELVFPDGLAALLPPERLLIAEAPREPDLLAVAEEALRDGATPFVVVEIERALSLREGRRLQLAARAGGATGLCLIPEGAGSNAAETRWRCTPVFDPAPGADSTLMRWEIIKNRSGTLRAWHVRWNGKAHRLDVVSPAPLGPGAEAAPDAPPLRAEPPAG